MEGKTSLLRRAMVVLLIQSESILISLCSCHKCGIECEVSLSHGKRDLPISWEVFLSHRKRGPPISWEERSPYLMGREVSLSHGKRGLPISWEERSPYLMGREVPLSHGSWSSYLIGREVSLSHWKRGLPIPSWVMATICGKRMQR